MRISDWSSDVCSSDLYKKFFNAWEVFRNDMIAFITYDEEHHRLAIGYVPDLRDRDQGVAGVDHFAFAFGSLGDLLANYIRLKNIGILPYWCINHGPTTSLYYRDLDGNQIETQVENFDKPEKLTAFFNSKAFQEHPRIGRAHV